MGKKSRLKKERRDREARKSQMGGATTYNAATGKLQRINEDRSSPLNPFDLSKLVGENLGMMLLPSDLTNKIKPYIGGGWHLDDLPSLELTPRDNWTLHACYDNYLEMKKFYQAAGAEIKGMTTKNNEGASNNQGEHIPLKEKSPSAPPPPVSPVAKPANQPASKQPKEETKNNEEEENRKNNAEKTCDCAWIGCKKIHTKKEMHPYDDINDKLYPDRKEGNTSKRPSTYQYTKKYKWKLPWEEGEGKTSDKIKPEFYANEVEIKNVAEAKKLLEANSEEYIVEFHHVIPVSVMKKFKNVLCKNAELTGWNINNPENGIVLPYFITDIFRHNLQCHRSNHPAAYSNDLVTFLEKLEPKTTEFCSEKKQKTLYTTLQRVAKRFKHKIKHWEIFLRSQAPYEGKKSYEQVNLAHEVPEEITKHIKGSK